MQAIIRVIIRMRAARALIIYYKYATIVWDSKLLVTCSIYFSNQIKCDGDCLFRAK